MPKWKAALAVVGLLVVSVWIVASAMHTVELACRPGSGCRLIERRAGLALHDTTFPTPSADQVTVRTHGKRDNLGTLSIAIPQDRLEVPWLSADEAQRSARELVAETAAGRAFALESHGPRWWLVFLLGTIPCMLSFVLPKRAIPTWVAPSGAPPAVGVAPERDRRARRAERGRQRKQRDREQR